MNIHVQVSVQIYVLVSLGHMPKSGIAGAYGLMHFRLNKQQFFLIAIQDHWWHIHDLRNVTIMTHMLFKVSHLVTL